MVHSGDESRVIDLNQDDIDELVTYLQNIENFEKKHKLSESSTIEMIFGLSIMIAGILDLNLALWSNYSPHFLPWFTLVGGAYITQQIIASQPLLFVDHLDNKTIARQTASRTEIVLFILLMFFPVLLDFENIYLVFPYIGTVFGTFNLYYFLKQEPKKRSKNALYVIFSFYIAALIDLIIGLFGNNYLKLYQGLIFGIIVGSTVFYSGWNLRKRIITSDEKNELEAGIFDD